MLINKKHVKAYALGVAESRAHKFTRVGNDFLERIDFALRELIRREVHALPSVGKTLK